MQLDETNGKLNGQKDKMPVTQPDFCALKNTGPDSADVHGRVTVADFDQLAVEFDDLSLDQIGCYKRLQQAGIAELFLARSSDKILGGAVVMIYALPMAARGVAHVRFGPFWRHKNQPAKPADYMEIITQLKREFAEKRGHMLTILPRPHPHHAQQESELLKFYGFRTRKPAASSSRFVVDLQLSVDDQMKNLQQKWRYNLRKALKSDVLVKRIDDPHGLTDFAAIHAAMLSRKQIKLADQPEMIAILQQQLPKALKLRCYLAQHHGEAVAGAIIAPMGDTALYLYGASSDHALPHNASYALHWHIVKELSCEAFKYYDLGGASQFDGLRQFKKGLAGKAGFEVEIPMEHDFWSSAYGASCGTAVHALRHLKNKLTEIRNTKIF